MIRQSSDTFRRCSTLSFPCFPKDWLSGHHSTWGLRRSCVGLRGHHSSYSWLEAGVGKGWKRLRMDLVWYIIYIYIYSDTININENQWTRSFRVSKDIKSNWHSLRQFWKGSEFFRLERGPCVAVWPCGLCLRFRICLDLDGVATDYAFGDIGIQAELEIWCVLMRRLRRLCRLQVRKLHSNSNFDFMTIMAILKIMKIMKIMKPETLLKYIEKQFHL